MVFLGDGSFSLLRDLKIMKDGMKKWPNSISIDKMMKENLGVEKLPSIVGLIVFGEIMTVFTDSTHLNDLYVNKNPNATKFSLG